MENSQETKILNFLNDLSDPYSMNLEKPSWETIYAMAEIVSFVVRHKTLHRPEMESSFKILEWNS